MARPGRTPTPTALKILRGNPGRRPLNKREPKPRPGIPVCPGWISREAKSAWRQLLPDLKAAGLLTRLDRNALARYCQLWGRWKMAELFIAENGNTYPIRDDEGRVKCIMQFPQVAIAHRLALQLVRLEQEFGLTPSARSRLQVTPPTEKSVDDTERFFNVG